MQPYTGDNPISGHQPYSFSLNLTRSLFPRARGPKLPTCARKSPILPPKLAPETCARLAAAKGIEVRSSSFDDEAAWLAPRIARRQPRPARRDTVRGGVC